MSKDGNHLGVTAFHFALLAIAVPKRDRSDPVLIFLFPLNPCIDKDVGSSARLNLARGYGLLSAFRTAHDAIEKLGIKPRWARDLPSRLPGQLDAARHGLGRNLLRGR